MQQHLDEVLEKHTVKIEVEISFDIVMRIIVLGENNLLLLLNYTHIIIIYF